MRFNIKKKLNLSKNPMKKSPKTKIIKLPVEPSFFRSSQSFTTGRTEEVVAVFSSATQVCPSFPGKVAVTIPIGHLPGGVVLLVMKTRSSFCNEV